MSKARTTKTDILSVKLFLLILGGIAAYYVSSWIRGEPEWEELVYEPGAFGVQIAGKPNLRKLREEFAFGQMEFQYLMFERKEVQYAISFGDVPAGVAADSAIAANRDVMLKKMQGKILAEEAVELAGHPARQTRIRASDESLLELRSGQVGQRLYSLMAAGAPHLIDDNPDIPLFFSSFKLLAE